MSQPRFCSFRESDCLGWVRLEHAVCCRRKGAAPPLATSAEDAENVVQKRIKQLAQHYVVELLSEHGRCDRIIGWGPDPDAARNCYDAAIKKHPQSTVRLRRGVQQIALRISGSSVLPNRKH
jgi:hypothetical protein